MRRLLVSLATIIILAGLGFIVGRLSVSAPTSSGQENVPVVWTVPVLITATQDPNAGPVVTIITATPLPGSIGVLPTGVIEDAELAATEAPAPTIDEAILEGDSVLQATVTALPEHCIAHVLADGEYPGLVAETYGVSVFDLLAVNGLDEDSARFLDIGTLLIVPLEGCPLLNAAATTPGSPQENVGVAGGTPTVEEGTAEVTEEATIVPTLTLPPTAVNAHVEIVQVVSPGDITQEGIEIRNTGGVVDLTGWTLSDSAGNVFTFPEQRLFTNGLVTLYTRRGTNTPIALFWGRSAPVWNKSGVVVTLTNADGDVQATLRLDDTVDLSGS